MGVINVLNAEKFKDKIMYSCDGEFGFTDGIVKCTYDKCDNCIFSNRNNQDKHESCSSRRVRWLLSEYKEPIKLSKLEYDILKYLSDNTRHMYIARNENGALYVFDVEPVKNNFNNLWTSRGASWLGVFNKLFQFVQWEDSEPTAIEDVLGNCEVIENE